VGFVCFAVPAPALMSAMSADARDRARALGLWSAYMPAGGTIALLAAPLFIALGSWRILWLVLAVAALIAALFYAREVQRSPPAAVSTWRLVAESLVSPGNIVMSLLFACYVAQWTSVMVWLPTFLSEHGATTAAAAIATAMMVLANVPGNLAGGWLLSRGIPRGALVIAACVIAALCELGMVAPALPGAARYALVLVFSGCAGVIPASIFAGLPVHARSRQHIATGTGMVQQLSNVGQFFGPLAIAWIASRYGGWEATLWAMLGFAGAGALCGAALGLIEKRRR
jgi:cyanate permease